MSQPYYLQFRLGARWYAMSIQNVLEVLHLVAITPIPDAPPDVLGVITLRDEVMRVIDLRVRFGINEPQLSLNTPLLAVSAGGEQAALVVDEVDNVIQVTDIQPSPEHSSTYVNDIAHYEGRVHPVLDVERLLMNVTVV